MSHYFTGRFANSYWKSRCRRQDYEWAPNEIDLDLWHHIIDELEMPSWIRAYRQRSAQPWLTGKSLKNSVYTKRYGVITTADMCDRTHVAWCPVARMYEVCERTHVAWCSVARMNEVFELVHYFDLFLGYFPADLEDPESLKKTDGATEYVGNSNYDLQKIILPPELYL